MENIYEVSVAIFIGTVVAIANYLLNTSRVLKAIELCKECLILHNKLASGNKKEPFRSAYIAIWSAVFQGFSLINDFTSLVECEKTLLAPLRACGDPEVEVAFLIIIIIIMFNTSIALFTFTYDQKRFTNFKNPI